MFCFSIPGELTAVYTPNKTITSSEILSSGKYLVIGMEGTNTLTILHLAGPTTEPFCLEQNLSSIPVQDYGIAENYGKIFDCEEGRWHRINNFFFFQYDLCLRKYISMLVFVTNSS